MKSLCQVCGNEFEHLQYQNTCSAECRKIKSKKYQEKYYLDNWEHKQLLSKISVRKWREENSEKYLLQKARENAKIRGLEFSLVLEDIIIPKLCPVFKVPLVPYTRYAPSLDRIDNNKGYIKGNIMVMSKIANTMKNNASKSELKIFADWIYENYKRS